MSDLLSYSLPYMRAKVKELQAEVERLRVKGGVGQVTDDGYPEEDELKKLEEWDFRDGFREWLEYAKTLWQWRDYFDEVSPGVYYVSTGGWSGHESVIRAMKKNFPCWSQCWRSTRAGGHYMFVVRNDVFSYGVKEELPE